MPLTLKLDEEVEGKRGNDLGDQKSVDECCVCIYSNSLLTFALTAFINEWDAIYSVRWRHSDAISQAQNIIHTCYEVHCIYMFNSLL